jgi:hypothetical protein
MMIACSVIHRECYHCASVSRNVVDLHFCEKGLHDIGAGKMCARLQDEIDAVDVYRYDAILLGYGLCNNGTLGLRASIPIVVPRAHDCITMLLGSKERYRAYFDSHPGTYYLSSGWIEHGTSSCENESATTTAMGVRSYEEYVEQYGEETAQYLMETLGQMRHYTTLAYIDTQVGDFPAYKEHARKRAEEAGWVYDELTGDTGLILRMMNGEWDEASFVVIQPGSAAAASFDESIFRTS